MSGSESLRRCEPRELASEGVWPPYPCSMHAHYWSGGGGDHTPRLEYQASRVSCYTKKQEHFIRLFQNRIMCTYVGAGDCNQTPTPTARGGGGGMNDVGSSPGTHAQVLIRIKWAPSPSTDMYSSLFRSPLCVLLFC